MIKFARFIMGANILSKSKPTQDRGRPDWFRRVSYGGSRIVSSVAKLLYEEATVFLDRKKKLADEILTNIA